jgi:cytochrome oxidase Cu insertion factor (SCO1/SenC/PrrC family)
LKIPDVAVQTHRGETLRFYSGLVQGKVVAINFLFTTCKGVCPPLGVNFAALSRQFRDRLGKDLALISISVDPGTDTPERLRTWSERYHGAPGWTLVTGQKADIDRLLKALGVFTADKNSHSPLILTGDEAAGRWSRIHGLSPPAEVAKVIDTMLASRLRPAPPEENAAAQHYFTDVSLVNQHGESMRLYSDLLRGKAVIIQSFFCSCKGACPVMVGSFAKLQEWLGDRLEKDVRLISITVDPLQDTPARLKEYADRIPARPGWYFLTGSKENIALALRKLGQSTEVRENHSNVFLVGNVPTGLWKKAMGLARPEELIAVVAGVIDDGQAPDSR